MPDNPAVTCRSGATAAVRQARRRARLRESGLIPVTVIMPAGAAADMQEAAEAMRAFPHLRPGPLRDPISGKLVSAAAVLKAARRPGAASMTGGRR